MSRADCALYSLGSAIAAATAGAAIAVFGGNYMFMTDGTAGGATVSLQILLPDGSWAPVQALAGGTLISTATLPYTASQIYLPAGNVRVNVAGGSGSSVNAWLVGIG